MEVFVAIVDERHHDLEVRVFEQKEHATAFTEKLFEEYVSYPEDIDCSYFGEPNENGVLALWRYGDDFAAVRQMGLSADSINVGEFVQEGHDWLWMGT